MTPQTFSNVPWGQIPQQVVCLTQRGRMIFLLFKGVLVAHSLRPGGTRKHELRPSRITPSVGPNMASQFAPLYDRSGFTQQENSPRVCACMFFHPLAPSPSLRSVCFSSLSDLPSRPARVLPSSSPRRSFAQPTQSRPFDAVLPYPSPGKAAGASTAPISPLTGVETISSANVDAQNSFQ